jgi:hypothetical protein
MHLTYYQYVSYLQGKASSIISVSVVPNNFRTIGQIFNKLGMNIMPLWPTPPPNSWLFSVSNNQYILGSNLWGGSDSVNE